MEVSESNEEKTLRFAHFQSCQALSRPRERVGLPESGTSRLRRDQGKQLKPEEIEIMSKDGIERRLGEIETIVGEIRRRLEEKHDAAPPPRVLYAGAILAIDCPVHGPRTCEDCNGSGSYGGMEILNRDAVLPCGACNGTGKDPIALAECMCKTTAEALGSDLPTFPE